MLLVNTRELSTPERGRWWKLPGDGNESGDHVDAVVRELREGTGITVMPEQVRPPTWQRTGVIRHCGVRRVQHEVVVLVRRDVTEPPIAQTGRLDYKREDYFDDRWWPTRDVVDSTETFYAGKPPADARGLPRRRQLDEPLDLWS